MNGVFFFSALMKFSFDTSIKTKIIKFISYYLIKPFHIIGRKVPSIKKFRLFKRRVGMHNNISATTFKWTRLQLMQSYLAQFIEMNTK